MKILEGLRYTNNDEWVKLDGNIATVGISDYAQEQLSDVVFVEILVSKGDTVTQGDSTATIESVKAAADVYIPISGVIIETNAKLSDTPEMINSDPYGQAWMVKIEIKNQNEYEGLLNSVDYAARIQERN
jgi:glycine cleavage system H protein